MNFADAFFVLYPDCFSYHLALMERISIKEVIKVMTQSGPNMPGKFSLSWVKLDRQKQTGGGLMVIENAICLNNANNNYEDVKDVGFIKPKHSHHRRNRTLNIREISPQGHEIGHVIKIHPTLILRFNGKKVFLS